MSTTAVLFKTMSQIFSQVIHLLLTLGKIGEFGINRRTDVSAPIGTTVFT